MNLLHPTGYRSGKSVEAISACVASALSGGRVLVCATSKPNARMIWTDVQTICELGGFNIRQISNSLKISWPK